MTTQLKRVLKIPGAVMMGLGSIIGTGLFVSVAIATEVAGSSVLIAIVLASLLAALNGLGSAQLAAAHPVSGGTYEYGNRFLGSASGFTAGWMFLIAKSASAATAVLGSVHYLFTLFQMETGGQQEILAGLLLLFLMTLFVSGGISRSNLANKIIVTFTLTGLFMLVAAGIVVNGLPVPQLQLPAAAGDWSSTLYATALMFVAYTGYGRIATLGEEVTNPSKTIPKAIIISITVIVLIYLSVTLTALHALGPEAFGQTITDQGAPLLGVAESLSLPVIGPVLTAAAVTAMMGVLLNLILGLSRVILAMARRGDVPGRLARINRKHHSPSAAVWVTGGIIGLLVLSGDIVFTWSFSAFTVLIYYSITNLSALSMPPELRIFSRLVPAAGLAGCLFLTIWIEPDIWIYGLATLLTGLIWHKIALTSRDPK